MEVVRVRTTGLAVLAAILAALALTATARAASTKPYSLVICALGPSESCAPNPTSGANQPAAVPSGATATPMTATFTNENKAGTGIRLGSANLTAPQGFAVTAASIPGCATCATVANDVVQLRGLALAPGSSVTVNMTSSTPSTGCTLANSCSWDGLP